MRAPHAAAHDRGHRNSHRWLALIGALGVLFTLVAGQLVRLAVIGPSGPRLAITEPLTRTFARPDIVDRHGRLLATDLEAPSLFADPTLIQDPDEAAEQLAAIFSELDQAELRRALADRTRRFVWIRRGLAPAVAQRVHDLGLIGLAFRKEPRRAYPQGTLAGHVLGAVNVDNRGTSGIERWIDEAVGVESVLGAGAPRKPPVRLALDLGVQHGLEVELRAAMARYQAGGAVGVLIDVTSGEVVAAASLPEVDPARPVLGLEPKRFDRLSTGVYELGSIFKVFTIAMALDAGLAQLDTVYDVRAPLRVGPHTMRDLYPQGRPLTVREIFVHSSNVGAGMLALQAGSAQQRAFLSRLGMLGSMATEAGPVTSPRLPARWGQAETITIAYGHGLALAPLQLAAAAAQLFNGGRAIVPTLRAGVGQPMPGHQLIAERTSAELAGLMRRNVTHPSGTGRQAEVAGFEIGGKTGTADIAAGGAYKDGGVISSFLAVFPASAPRYLTLVSLFEPRPTEETRGKITAGVNAAPTTARIIARVAPLLDVATH